MKNKTKEEKQPVKWMSVEAIAVHLDVSKETIYRFLEAGTIPSHRVGKLHKFDPIEVDEAVKRGKLG